MWLGVRGKRGKDTKWKAGEERKKEDAPVYLGPEPTGALEGSKRPRVRRQAAQASNTDCHEARVAEGCGNIADICQKQANAICCHDGCGAIRRDHEVNHGVKGDFKQLLSCNTRFHGKCHSRRAHKL